MAMDGLNLYAATQEIRALCGGKIDKIHQPEKDELVLLVRAEGENHRLLLSANPMHARAQLTDVKRANPLEAPVFCMLLRKKLLGGRIVSVDQPNMDRVLNIVVQAQNELGDSVPYTLCAEVMGKYSNLVLINEAGAVVDAIKRVGPGMSEVRVLLPGVPYVLPPPQQKRDIRQASQAEIAGALVAGRVDKALSGAFFGIAPNMAAALCERVTSQRDCELLTSAEKEALAASLYALFAELKEGVCRPALALDAYGAPLAIYPFVPNLPDCSPLPTMRQALDTFYERQDIAQRMQRHGGSLRRVLQNNIERCLKKLALYEGAIDAEDAIERLRLYGELLTANQHAIAPGVNQAMVQNYYFDPPAPIVIPLNPQFSAGVNARQYYKKYQKAKAARDISRLHRAAALEELAYLEGQLDNLGKCTDAIELAELSEELGKLGYIKHKPGEKKPAKLPASKPMHFVSSDGADIFVGKNNRQNDDLTLRAAGEDIWLHTKEIPGSHVIIKQAEPSKATLYEACLLAAYYSKARGSGNVPVDYAPRKHVKKPAGAKPGMVVYTANKTAYVTPADAEVKAIKQV
ncbi:MAG: NFACT family protein [Christensenellaceae bacterium]|jgi:predicted ribosome quality control (RQC) complex YloA/Tae2 family protein|nr:NFACT family protein [Christensenellaceae bacterium]